MAQLLSLGSSPFSTVMPCESSGAVSVTEFVNTLTFAYKNVIRTDARWKAGEKAA